MMEPHIVVDVILKCLFTDRLPSQIMVDRLPNKLLIALLSSLPCTWQDKILSL
jgi:hypothetical protein